MVITNLTISKPPDRIEITSNWGVGAFLAGDDRNVEKSASHFIR